MDAFDRQAVANDFEAIVYSDCVTGQTDGARTIARFANARRLRNGEITFAEFEKIMDEGRRSGPATYGSGARLL